MGGRPRDTGSGANDNELTMRLVVSSDTQRPSTIHPIKRHDRREVMCMFDASHVFWWVSAVSFGLCCWVFLKLIRNRWVYNVRSHVLSTQGMKEYQKLPSYEHMMKLSTFNVWDVEQFKQEDRA